MRCFLSVLCYLIVVVSIAAQTPADSQWFYFYPAGEADAVAQTETHISFAVRDYLLRIDKQSHAIHRIDSPFGAGVGVRQLWVDSEDQVYSLFANWIGFPSNEEEWAVSTINSNGLYLVERLIHQEEDGDFLFLGQGVARLFRWRPGSSPSMADNLNDILPWRVDKIVWDTQRQGYWASKANEVGFVSDDVFVAVDFPPGLGNVEELHIAQDGALWVRTLGFLLKYTGSDWLVHEFPEVSSGDEFTFATLNDGSALVVSENRRSIIVPTTTGFQVTDHSESLA